MKVAGIDYSTYRIDIVLVSSNPYDLEGDCVVQPLAYQLPLVAKGDAFERTRRVGAKLPGRTSPFWDEIEAVGIEEPTGYTTGYQSRVQGAILSMIPADMLVQPWRPTEWKKRVGLPGNASKDEIVEHASVALRALGREWTVETNGQDCFDAFEIAIATRDALVRDELVSA